MANHLHCVYCFDAVAERLLNDTILSKPEPQFENESYPLFVTWNIRKGNSLSLRGCIGSFSSQDLHSGLYNYAQISAFKDSRFNPITREELEHLQASCWNDFEIGKHGIRISYNRYSATYLPEVALDQGWDHHETMESLMRKAGFYGEISDSIKSKIQVERYQSSKAYMTCDEWLQLKGIQL